MSITTEEKHDEMPSERDVSLQNGSLPDNKSIDDDSDSPPLERPTRLSVGSKYDRISVDESLESERYLCISNQSRDLFIDHPESVSFVCVLISRTWFLVCLIFPFGRLKAFSQLSVRKLNEFV